MNWKEYKQADETVADWLPWGGLTHPSVVQEKDGSFFSVIRYQPVARERMELDLPPLKNGWSLWLDQQHRPEAEDRHFLVLCWNPFLSGAYGNEKLAGNVLQDVTVTEAECLAYFASAAETLAVQLARSTEARLLRYQEIIDYLAFAISMGEESVEMPEVPLYLDALLSQDLDLSLAHNDIALGDKRLVIFSLPALAEAEQHSIICEAFGRVPFRHVKRLLALGEAEAERSLKGYMGQWCSGRKSIKKLLSSGLKGRLNVLYSESYQLLVRAEDKVSVEDYVQQLLALMEIPFIIEDYNRKDVWWGSLPGLFRANIQPSQLGFAGLGDLLDSDLDNGKEALA